MLYGSLRRLCDVVKRVADTRADGSRRGSFNGRGFIGSYRGSERRTKLKSLLNKLPLSRFGHGCYKDVSERRAALWDCEFILKHQGSRSTLRSCREIKGLRDAAHAQWHLYHCQWWSHTSHKALHAIHLNPCKRSKSWMFTALRHTVQVFLGFNPFAL